MHRPRPKGRGFDISVIEDFKCNFYGVIHKINADKIDARIYDYKTNELVDDITFDISEFSLIEQSKLVENVIFTWDVGSKDNVPYSVFKLKKREPLTEEEKAKKEKDIQDTINFFDSLGFNK